MQKDVKVKMNLKLKQFFTGEVPALLYLAAFLDPLHVNKIKTLGCDDATKDYAMHMLRNRLEDALRADDVRAAAAPGDEPAASHNSQDSWVARKKLKSAPSTSTAAAAAVNYLSADAVIASYLEFASIFRQQKIDELADQAELIVPKLPN